jgi:2-polyprenyl-6-hydroxyphenyl methylase/3-demethylubiquinone-9 3-methyltransferase
VLELYRRYYPLTQPVAGIERYFDWRARRKIEQALAQSGPAGAGMNGTGKGVFQMSEHTTSDVTSNASAATSSDALIDTSSDPRFTAYYEEASQSQATINRFANVKTKIDWLFQRAGRSAELLDVADIGCGAGTQAIMWAQDGHRISGIDINAPLVEIAQKRLTQAGLQARFDVGSATALPYADASFDVVLLPELLEHVDAWQACLDEALRVLRPNGVIFLSTTNSLCPRQLEFDLPLYSWYPAVLKRHCVKLALTTHPQWVSHARYPAVNWFTPYELGRYLARHGVKALDRFDMLNLDGRPVLLKAGLTIFKALPPLRLLGHMFTPGTALFGIRK